MVNSVTTTNAMGRIKLEGYKCERCGHIWFPRKYDEKTEGLPVLCPKCKSAYWNRPKRGV